MKVIFNFKNNTLPKDILKLFKYSTSIHDHDTRNTNRGGLFIPSINTTAFGNKSLRYYAPVTWNEQLSNDVKINDLKTSHQFKIYMKNSFLSKYKQLQNDIL